ncbi:MAG: SAM-dependent methyltransferase [Lachnospiraceae bacterium]|nr:SAM-dependent methyltransferase [Lachnospiraceae bacterium]
MELSIRLKSVAEMVTPESRVADVGCDHGYVSIYLVRNGIATHAIAMDINAGPLASARQNVEREGLAAYIETRRSDGLKMLESGEADTVICAGMGGRLTIRILSEGDVLAKGVRELILQPQSEIGLVRKYLYENDFVITAEKMVIDDGKYYQMMRAQPAEEDDAALEGGKTLSEAEAWYGPCLLAEKNRILLLFLRREREKCREIIGRIEKNSPEKSGNIKEKCLLIEEALAGYTNEMQTDYGNA